MEFDNRKFNTILTVLASALLVIIVFGTLFALASHHRPGSGLRHADPAPESVTGTANNAFTSIGQLRTSSALDEKNHKVVIVITPWLAYEGNDKAFYEELDSKIRAIRSIITSYFPRFTEKQLYARSEEVIKSELLSAINATLVLGKVSAIYFNEYQFLQ